jgi:hypothetical protein
MSAEECENVPDEFRYLFLLSKCDFRRLRLSLLSLRHLKMLKLIADGNFKLNRFSKNTDPNDRSLMEGHATGYFPPKDVYAKYLDDNPVAHEVRYSRVSHPQT